ncbi:hypothetical protein RHMOL_Rhmol08G0136200 [Rhododendron molle]|uniref:Uncharacterized protein n=1 Tax=Rhododendron molle TaxID=49168 RepID=A0ACC0MMY8_RHOML|nr:hypothetical protein RHMOL_Rhmol08G0136200 [Rhododendron molle]
MAGTDGVGTKLKLAFETGIHEIIGIDLVIKGIVDGCQQSDCTLLGREAGRIEDAEMRRTFNMGIGMVLVVSQEAALRILGDAQGAYTAYRIGEIALGLSCMTVESDNKEAILLSISELVLTWEVFALVLDTRELVLSSALKFNWIRRTRNKLAHPVAALARRGLIPINWVSVTSSFLSAIVMILFCKP